MFKPLPAALVAAALLSSQALAESVPAPPSQSVSTRGVNFDNPAEVAQLYARLQQAADAVCRADANNRRVTDQDPACRTRALANVVESAHKPLLTAQHQCGCIDKVLVARGATRPDGP